MRSLVQEGELVLVGLVAQMWEREFLAGRVVTADSDGVRITEWRGVVHVVQVGEDRYEWSVETPDFGGTTFVVPWHSVRLLAIRGGMTTTGPNHELSQGDGYNFDGWLQLVMADNE